MDQNIQLLQQIADNTARNDSVWIAIAAGAAGVLGAGLTAWCSYLIAKKSQQTEEKRLRASVVTAERLRWLQDIRQRLARFYVQLDMQYNYLKRPIPQTPEAKTDYQRQLDVFSNEVNEQCNIITLMINPQKPDQNNLKSALQESIIFIRGCVQKRNAIIAGMSGLILGLNDDSIQFDELAYRKIKTKAFDSLTNIGIETWGRIKELE